MPAYQFFTTDNPTGDALLKLKPAGEHRFRRIRADGALGEGVVFERGADGTPTRMLHHSNYAYALAERKREVLIRAETPHGLAPGRVRSAFPTLQNLKRAVRPKVRGWLVR